MKPNDRDTLIHWLFATRALRAAPADEPFWYTSGTLGPYYINTHFLFGSEEDANGLLRRIDELAASPLDLPAALHEAVLRQYEQNPIYRQLMDQIAARLAAAPGTLISGGERRDYFFSVCAAHLLGKPHIYLFKDQTAVISPSGGQNAEKLEDSALAGSVVCHVADLVTEASSYTRAWLPALRRVGARMPMTLAVVDRNQNGRQVLEAEGTRLVSLMTIDQELFYQARAAGLIDDAQLDQILRFTADPQAYMRLFLREHPAFLAEQLALGGKNAERARRCLESGYGPEN